MDAHAPAAGLLGSIRGLADGLLSAARERVELLTIELQEEKFRLIQVFVWISAAVFSAMLAIAFASFTLVVLFWDSARLPVLIGLTVLYTAAFVVILLACRSYVAKQPRPFQGTIEELQRDQSCTRPQS